MTSSNKGLLKGTAIVSVANLLSRVLGFAQRQILAYCFGTGLLMDAFVVANQSIGFSFHSIPRQALAPFLPLFVDRRVDDGEDAAWRSAYTVATLLFVIMGVATVAGIVGAPYLVAVAAGRDNPALFDLAVSLVRIILPAAFLLAFAAYAYLLLNSYKRFAVPAFGESVNRLTLILVTLLLYRVLGITAAAIGVVVGAAVCLSIQIFALRRRALAYRPQLTFQDPVLRRMGVLVPPVLIGALLAVARTLFDYRVAVQLGEGFAAGISYARGINDTLIMFAPFALGVAIYPYFSEYAARRDFDGLTDLLMRTSRLMVFFFAPMAVGLVLLREGAVTLAFQRGEFDVTSVALTTGPLAFFAVGLPTFAVEIILMQCFFAMKDTRTPVLVGIAALVVHVVCVLMLRDVMGHTAIALAATVAKTVKNLVLYILLRRKTGNLQFRTNTWFTLKMVVCLLVMTGVVFMVRRLAPFSPQLDAGASRMGDVVRLALFLGTAAAAGATAFFASAWIVRLTELRLMIDRVRRRSSLTP